MLRRGRVVSKDELIESLWPESRPRNGTAAVESYVSVVRARLAGASHTWRRHGRTRRTRSSCASLLAIRRLIIFDKRGTGRSDAVVDWPTLGEGVEDLLCVMDAAGSELAVVFGVSEGAPLCALAAALHRRRGSRAGPACGVSPADQHAGLSVWLDT